MLITGAMTPPPDRWIIKDELAEHFGLSSVHGFHRKTASDTWPTTRCSVPARRDSPVEATPRWASLRTATGKRRVRQPGPHSDRQPQGVGLNMTVASMLSTIIVERVAS